MKNTAHQTIQRGAYFQSSQFRQHCWLQEIRPLVAKTRASHKGSAGKRTAQVIAEIREENDWKNHLVLFWLPDGFLEVRPVFDKQILGQPWRIAII